MDLSAVINQLNYKTQMVPATHSKVLGRNIKKCLTILSLKISKFIARAIDRSIDSP